MTDAQQKRQGDERLVVARLQADQGTWSSLFTHIPHHDGSKTFALAELRLSQGVVFLGMDFKGLGSVSKGTRGLVRRCD